MEAVRAAIMAEQRSNKGERYMRFKLFTADNAGDVESAVNEWLAGEKKQPAIHKSETSLHAIKEKGLDVAFVTVAVWYD
jgi:hypothetical protein